MKTKSFVKSGLPALVASFTVCLTASSAWAITINVPADQPTIQAAINASSSGDTISIAPGTYNENLNVNKAVTMVSAGGRESVTIQGSAAQSASLGGGNTGTVCISASNVRIGTSGTDGITIRGYDWTAPGIEHSAVYLKSTATTGLSIIGNNLVADGESALLSEYASTQGIEIAHNTFSGKTYVGTTVGGNSSVQYTVPNVPRSMIYFGGACRNISFHDNIVSGSVGGVITGTSNSYYNTGATLDCAGAPVGQGAAIAGNTFSIPSWASLRARGSNSIVTGNVFDSSSASPLAVGTYYENTATGSYTGNSYVSGTGQTTLVGDGSSTVVLPGNYSAYTLALVATPSGTAYRATGPDRTVFMANQATATFADQTVTLSALSLPVVRPVPSGYSTIQAAINAASAGETVEVAAGTYHEQLTINKPLTVTGADGATLDGTGLVPTWTTGVKIRSGNVTFNNIDVANFTQDGITAYDNINMPNLHITNCRISNIQPGYWGFGIYVGYESEGFEYSPPDLTGHLDFSGLLIEGNEITNVHSSALVIQSLTGTPGTLQVKNNNIHGNATNSGIWVDCARNLLIENNTITGNKWGVEFSAIPEASGQLDGPYSPKDIIVRGNLVSSSTFQGVVLYQAWPATFTVSENNIVGNAIGIDNQVAAQLTATHNYWGNEDGPTGTTNGVSGSVTFSPWYADAARTILRDGIVEDLVITTPQTYGDLYIAPGTTVTVTPEGSLAAGKVELADGAEITVNGGELDLGQDSVISGTFTIFNSFGSWDINGDTTFNIGQSLALISDIHVAAGKTVTVNGGGELILDGCIMDSQTPGTPYNFTAATDGLLTLARCVVTDANIDINTTLAGNLRSRVYDNSFITSDIEAGAAAKVYHNLFDAATEAAKNTDATTAFDAIDGWANVTSAGALQNKFTLDFEAPVAIGRTLDAAGNLFVQPADAVVVKMDVAALGTNTITAAEALLGYNSGMLTLAGSPTRVTPLGAWEVIAETAPAPSGLGIVDSALGLQLEAGQAGISADSQIARVNFTAGSPGLTLGFFRVQTNGQFNPDGTLVKDTRLTKSTAGMPSLLEAFTANTGELVIDNQLPAIATTGQTGTQVQPTNGTVDVLNPANYVIRNGTPVMLSFTATDAGLAGLDAPDATADLALTAYNGTTTLGTADYTVTAVETAGVVTYTVTLNVPVTASTGTYAVTATVRDRSGNVSPLATLGSFQIANEVLATVELEAYAGGTRQVVFTATDSSGTFLTSWTKNVVFAGTTGTVPLEAVPSGTAAISAKTAWNLRSKLAVAFSGVGVGAVSLTGTDKLPGGDITGDNVVNTLDYSLLRYHWLTDHAVANINGDTIVNLADYNVLKGNFYTIGDPQ